MKELLEALKAKYEGVSETVLKITANSMAKKGLSVAAVEETTLDGVVTAYADYRATEAAKTALKANEQKQQPLKGGETVETGATEQDAPAWAKTLITQNEELTKRLTAIEGEKVTATRQSQFCKTFEALPAHLQAPYKRIAQTTLSTLTDEEFEALQAEVKTEVEGIVTAQASSGVSFTPPAAGGAAPNTGEISDEAAKELIKNII